MNKCIVNSCLEKTHFQLCSVHLFPEKYPYQIFNSVTINPSTSKSTNRNINESNAILNLNPSQFGCKKKRKRIKDKLLKQIEINENTVNILYTKIVNSKPENDFFGPSERNKTDFFRSVTPLEEKHTIALTPSHEILFFLPAKKSLNKKNLENLKKSIQNTFKYMPTFQNKKAQQRKTKGRWVFSGLKWSSFNASEGVTNYKSLIPFRNSNEYENHENFLWKQIRNTISAFNPIMDVLHRQQVVYNQIISSNAKSPIGSSIAIGQNFASSCHIDNDLSLTFSGSIGRNSFLFPAHNIKICFDDQIPVTLFCFNSKFHHCAENLIRKENEKALLYSIYSSAVVVGQSRKAVKDVQKANYAGVDDKDVAEAIHSGGDDREVAEASHSVGDDREVAEHSYSVGDDREVAEASVAVGPDKEVNEASGYEKGGGIPDRSLDWEESNKIVVELYSDLIQFQSKKLKLD